MFPFSAIVGQEEAKLALLLSAVDPEIGGVLLSGVKGTGKSTLVRSFAAILPEIDVVEGCPYHCDPSSERGLCEKCKRRSDSGEELPLISFSPRIITVPLGTTEDRLLGTIDVEKMLREGEAHFEPGLLAEANNQVLYIDEVNLLPDNITDDILDSVAIGFNTIEREGLSIVHPANFSLVGTMNPEEGQLRPQILDRFALSVKIDTVKKPQLREVIVERAISYSFAREKFERAFAKSDHILKERIEEGRNNLKDIKIPGWAIKSVATAMSQLGVDGQRPDIVAIKSAIAYAALEGDSRVDKEHLKKSVPMAVCHRTRNGGFDPPATPEETVAALDESINTVKKGESKTESMILSAFADHALRSAIAAIENESKEVKKNG